MVPMRTLADIIKLYPGGMSGLGRRLGWSTNRVWRVAHGRGMYDESDRGAVWEAMLEADGLSLLRGKLPSHRTFKAAWRRTYA